MCSGIAVTQIEHAQTVVFISLLKLRLSDVERNVALYLYFTVREINQCGTATSHDVNPNRW